MKNQAEPILSLSVVMIELFGVPWTFGQTVDDRQFLLLLVHIACIETKMILEDQELIYVSIV